MNDIFSGRAGAAAADSYQDKVTITEQMRERSKLMQQHSEQVVRHNDDMVRQGRALMDANERNNELLKSAQKAEDENNHYKQMLAKPLIEIIQEGESYKKAYEQQQVMITKWLLSQRCMKKVALDIAEKMGMNLDDVMKMHENNKQKVLKNHDSLEGIIDNEALKLINRDRGILS